MSELLTFVNEQSSMGSLLLNTHKRYGLMIDALTDRLLSLRDVANRLPGRRGKRVHYNTVTRWARCGVKGVKLETALIGGNRFTTEEALSEFFSNLGSAKRRMPRKAATRDALRREFGIEIT